jgi:hypothetical protein
VVQVAKCCILSIQIALPPNENSDARSVCSIGVERLKKTTKTVGLLLLGEM